MKLTLLFIVSLIAVAPSAIGAERETASTQIIMSQEFPEGQTKYAGGKAECERKMAEALAAQHAVGAAKGPNGTSARGGR